ncbi:MAG: hypothetical protein LBJ21_02780 [Acidobacteriota bacterium]|jgi:hypothetical protein|nr:hypothetical protein [Acidobacteriota bacterium]
MPGVRVIGTTIACESTVEADIESGINGALDDIIAALTKPLTAEESSPQPKTEPEPRLAFKGSYQDVNNFFYRKGWGDGLPVSPPTEAAVAEMLTGTDLPSDHIVAKLIPRGGKATVEKIAVNAVMAGALPVHMPVIIAAVEALSDEGTRFDTFEVSTGSWAPFFLINGPVRSDIHINVSSGALSPGNIANAAIGRAVGLIVKNIGGARKAVEDMGTLGNPGKWSLVLGENEEESPWDPYHVDNGYKKEDSVITVFFPNRYAQTIPAQTHAEGIAASVAGMIPGSLSALIVIPDHAKILASEGWSKQRVKDFIIKQNSGLTASGIVDSSPSRRLQDEDFILIVAGGPGVWHGLLQSAGGFKNSFVSKKITLPKNWDQMVAKYKNMVPNYVRY